MHISKRDTISKSKAWSIRAIAILLALIVDGIIIYAIVKMNPLKVYVSLASGAFGTSKRMWFTIRDCMILTCIAIGLAPAFKMRFWNVGAEGQMLVGGIATAFWMINFAGKMNLVLLFLCMIVSAIIAGGIWGVIPGFFKAKWNTNETLFTLMMNYIAIQLTSFAVSKWENPPGSNSIGTINAKGDVKNPIPKGKRIQKNFLGKDIANYDSMLVLSHFKGHPMGGFGGALKQLSIGCASSYGKAYIHGAGEPEKIWTADHDSFLESMADAASSVVDYFKGNMVFVNVMKNMSVDCDCCAVAEDPCMKDIGILVSLDPVAVDQACLDLVYASQDPGRDHLLKRIESRHGVLTVEAAAALGVGSREYELVEL